MKVMAFNGSPRKEENTAKLLKKVLEGAESQGAETELVHLYDLDYKGCMSCFSCKTGNGNSHSCVVNDDLTPFLKKIEETDAIILGTPIYFMNITGEMGSFMERLMYPYFNASDPSQPSFFPKKINIGFIYTMDMTEELTKEVAFDKLLNFNEFAPKITFGGSPESLLSFDTYQRRDSVDAKRKAKRRREVFPKDCEGAFEMGAKFARCMDK